MDHQNVWMLHYLSSQTAPLREAPRVRSRMFTRAGCTSSVQLRPRGAQTWWEGEWRRGDHGNSKLYIYVLIIQMSQCSGGPGEPGRRQ